MTSLTVFLWVYIGTVALGVLARFILLSYKPYPRSIEWTRAEDCIAIIVHSGFAVWAWTLLP